MGEHTEPLLAVSVLNTTRLTVTAGSAHTTAAPAHYWCHPYGGVAAGGLRQHAAGRPW